MVSVDELVVSARNANWAQFWIDIVSSKETVIEKFIAESEFGASLADSIRFFKDLEALSFGIAPNSDELNELVQHFGFQGCNVSIIDCQDEKRQSNQLTQSVDNTDSAFINTVLQEINDKFARKVNSFAFDEFFVVFVRKIRDELIELLGQIQQIESLNDKVVFTIVDTVASTLCNFFLLPEDDESTFLTGFISKGYVFARMQNDVFIIFGMPSRKKYLENLVFGKSVLISLKNLGCSAFVEHKNGNSLEIYFDDDEELEIALRASDVLKLTFTNDVGFRKIENFELLSQIPCSVEIGFSVPKHSYTSDESRISKRQNERMRRLQKLVKQLAEIVPYRIVSIDFSNVASAVNSEALNLIEHCKGLINLNLNNTRISNIGFRNLSEFHNLKSLDISGIEIKPEGFNLFNLFPALRILRAVHTPKIIELIAKCEILPPISTLDLSDNSIDFEAEHIFPRLDFLQAFTARNTDLAGSKFKFLKKMPRLRILDLKNSVFSAESLNFLVQIAGNVTSLDLSTNKVDMNLSGSDFSAISTMPSLQELKIESRLLGDDFIENLTFSAKNLTALDISYNLLTNFAFTHICKFTKLHSLKLTGCQNISDSGISILCNSPLNLKGLDIRGTKITEAGIAMLSNRFPNTRIDYSIRRFSE